MATMKDVAKLAGVSHGTVSNIINGARGVSLDKVRRVEKAMRELRYEPNAMARNLKLSKTMQFDVILPNIVASSLSQIYTNFSMMATEKAYVANLRLTNEDAELETKLLNEALMYNKDGVLLVTCQPQNTPLFERLRASGLVIVFLERAAKQGGGFVGIDSRQAAANVTGQLVESGIKCVGLITGPKEYSFEHEMFMGYEKALAERGLHVDETICATSNYDRESALKEAVAMLARPDIPGAILVSSSQFMDAVLKAIELLNIPIKKKPLVAAFTPSSWADTRTEGVVKVHLPYSKLAEQAFEMLLGMMKKKKGGEACKVLGTECVNIADGLTEGHKPAPPRPKKTLRLLLTEDKAKDAVKALVAKFEYETGYRVEIEARRYNKMYQAVKDEWYKNNFDVFDIDIPWISELAQKGVLEPLAGYMKSDPGYERDVPAEIMEEYCVRDGMIYGMPFTFCTQLLFYRKDHFSDLTVKRMFYEQYKRDLKPPRTWQEYNEVAKFFTRSYNAFSPTEFGTTLGSRVSSGGTCEFLPRLWAFGGDVYGEDGFTLNSEQAVLALENYKESFKYASPESVDNWWPEQAGEFKDGKAAMMMTFADNISAVTERDKSQIIGKIGYELVPGKVNVDGGWVLAMNAYSENKREAFEFMRWACSRELSIISTILGGFVPRRTVFENMEISNIYPWLRKTSEAKKFGRLRMIPKKKDGNYMSEALFEDILGEAVYHAVTNQITPKNALNIANTKLNRLLADL